MRAASRSLGELIDRDPSAARLVDATDPLPDAGSLGTILRAADADEGGWRAERRRRILQIAARDLAGEATLTEVGRALADLADACLAIALERLDPPPGLCVIAMGKLGGRELNYASDIDLMFVTKGDVEAAVGPAEKLVTDLAEFTPEGRAYRVDLDLRPEGRSGALVRSLDGCLEYYRRWASDWEFQALLKARPAAGDVEAGNTLIEETIPLVFQAPVSPQRVASVRGMKERIEGQVARSARKSRSAEAADVKLGPGGIRDIEFTVQLLQLVHGGADPSVRSANTLAALAALAEGGYVAEDDAAGLSVAYEWLRTVEHRLQLWQERQVHTLPANTDERARVARMMGFHDSPSVSAVDGFDARHAAVLADVRGRFEKVFYRPMIESLAEAVPHRLSEDALKERLRILGFRDVDRAARTLARLVGGTGRQARLFRVLTPALLRSLSTAPLPDDGLYSFLRLSEALGNRIESLGGLRDHPPALSSLARVLGSGRILGELLAQVPEEIASVAAEGAHLPGQPDRRARLLREATASLTWRSPSERLDGLRRFKRRVLVQTALDDISGRSPVSEVGKTLADVADACLHAALGETDFPFAVIGMGKLGGRELGYSSDIDVMFVHAGDPARAERTAEELVAAVGEVTPEGRAFRVDAQVRPEGKAGPLARTVDSFVEYYGKWGRPWEYQARIKARFAAGNAELAQDFFSATHDFAFPERLTTEQLAELRHLKARMERERIPRGTDARRNFKVGPGGTADIEFSAQVIQLRHGFSHPELQVPPTEAALRAARDLELITEEEEQVLIDGYRFLSALRNRLFFISGRPVDALPQQPEKLEALGIAMGYIDQPRQELEEDYLRTTRRVRNVAERLIYGPK